MYKNTNDTTVTNTFTSAPSTKRKQILIEMIGDLSCPWCWVAKRRLDQVLASSDCASLYNVQVRNLPFLLNPSLPPAEELKCLHFPPTKPENFSPELLRCALRVGLGSTTNFRANNLARCASTVQAHCLLKFAEQQTDDLGIQYMLVERLFNSFLGNGTYPTIENMLKYVKEVGLNVEQARMFLESREEEGNLRVESLQYANRGVRQLPFFILNGKAMFAGYQDHTIIMQAMKICPILHSTPSNF